MTASPIDALRDLVCRGATDAEWELFRAACERLGLDPVARQIYAVRRWDRTERREVMALQVSIDGMRLVASRTGEYEGQTPCAWCGDDGAWRDVWLGADAPAAARVGVYRRGFREPLVAIARSTAYIQRTKDGSPTRFWSTMPDVMVAKCAEALALRRAFPQELSGIYSPEEMREVEPPPLALPAPEPAAALPADTREADAMRAELLEVADAAGLIAWCDRHREAARSMAREHKRELRAMIATLARGWHVDEELFLARLRG